MWKAILAGFKAALGIILWPIDLFDSMFFSNHESQAQAAANEGHEQAQASDTDSKKAREIGDYASSLRGLARRRFEGLAIDDSLWNRLTPELKIYCESLTLAECEIASKMRITQIAKFLESKADEDVKVVGLRHPDEILASPLTSSKNLSTNQTKISELVSKNPVQLDAFRNLIDSSIAKAGDTKVHVSERKLG